MDVSDLSMLENNESLTNFVNHKNFRTKCSPFVDDEHGTELTIVEAEKGAHQTRSEFESKEYIINFFPKKKKMETMYKAHRLHKSVLTVG